MDINGKTLIVTGGGQLGRAMAIELAGAGANLALIDLNEDPLNEAVQMCKQAGGDARAYKGNVAIEEEIISIFDAIEADSGEIHGLINNAGILRDGLLVKVKDGQVEKRMSLAEWQAVIDVNLTGVFLCGREAATRMIQKKVPGCIINTGVSPRRVIWVRVTILLQRQVLLLWQRSGPKNWLGMVLEQQALPLDLLQRTWWPV